MYNEWNVSTLLRRLRHFCFVTVTAIALAQDGGAGSKDKSALAPAAEAGQAKVDPNTYIIGAEDVLLIRVWREPELSGQVVVRPDGKITIQLLGEVMASATTPEGLAKDIRERLEAKFMKNPEVTVTVSAVHSKKYFIQGEVNRTGPFPLLVPTTILEALVNAGGFRDFAKQTKIFVMRGEKRHYFNYKDFMKGKNPQQNIRLQNGDIIVVP